LTRLLEASSAQAILITAPPGYGKTLLASEWLEGRADVAWYRATPASADLAAFSVGIVDAMSHVVPGAGERLRQRLVVSEPPDRAARPMADLLAEDIADWPAGARLVIDDYHLVTNSAPVEEFMDWLLTLAPGLKVLVTSRRRPTWASARRFLQDEIVELTTPQLAMSDAEAAVLLDGRSSESVRRLVAQAQGWPALIALAALSASAVPDELVTDRLYRYFAEEVVRTQSPATQRLMLLAAVPSSVDVDIARDLLGSPDPEGLIARLEHDGLLQSTTPGTYAFHPLLRDFLRRKLETEAPDDFTDLAQRVIAHAREHRRWEEAFGLAAYCGDLDTAVELIAEASEDLLPAGQIETLEGWLETCGPAATRVPALLVKIECLSRRRQLSEALGLASQVAGELPADSPYASQAWYLAGYAASLLSKAELGLSCQLKALETARKPAERRNALWGATIAAAELESDAVDDFVEQLSVLAPDDINTRLRTVVGRGWAAKNTNELADVWDLFEATIPLVGYADDPVAKSSFLSLAGYLACLRADYRVGREFAEQARELCVQYRLEFATVLCQVPLAYADTAHRHSRKVIENLIEIDRIAKQTKDPYLESVHRILGGRLALSHDDLPQALEHLQRPIIGQPPKGLVGELLGMTAMVEAALGYEEKAAEHAAQARAETGSAEAAHLALLADLIARMKGAPSLSDEIVIKDASNVFLAAHAQTVLDPVVMAYRAYPPLLETLSRHPPIAHLVRDLCLRANDKQRAASAGLLTKTTDPIERGLLALLTRREREVLTLLSAGLSNSEMAKRLFIAESTVKVHVRNILRKLGVRSRLQAALLSRDMFDSE
jgi:ATP/maltotriose-dependent transcriptional regulator MalT